MRSSISVRAPIRNISVLSILALIWGSSFILMKEGLYVYNQWQVAALRISIAGLVLLPFVRWKAIKIESNDWPMFLISGLLGNFIPAFLFTAAQTRISSSLSGALNSLTPLFVLLIGLIFMGVKFNKFKLYGVILGLSGALLLIFSRGFETDSSELSYSMLVVLAALCYGTNVNIIKYKLGHYPPFLVAAIPLAMMSVIALSILAVIGLEFSAQLVEIKAGLAIVVLAVFGTSLSLILFNRLIQRTNAVFASSVTYLIPIVALAWGWLDGEVIGLSQILGLFIVLMAIWIVNRSI